MHGLGALLITISGLSPSIGVFIVGNDVLHSAGTSVFLCFVAAAVLGLFMAAVYGELASAFPDTGGEYTIMSTALGPPWGVAGLAICMVGYAASQPLSGQGVASYLAVVWPGLQPAPTAAVLVTLVTLVGVLNIRINALVTGVFLGVEFLALVVVGALGFLHPHRSIATAVLNPVVLGAHGGFAPVALAVAGSSVAGAIYAFNGYGSAVYLGEEIHEAPKRMAAVVFISLGVAVVLELLPLLAVLIGAPDLHALLAAPAPISHFVAVVGGPVLGRVMSLGVALAIFNAMIAVALSAGRQLYSTGRDGLWPAPISRALAQIHPRFESPWIATLVIGAAGLLGCFIDPKLLVLILGNGNVALYAGLCLAVLMGRKSGATGHGHYKMPLHPWPSILALLFLAGVVWFDLHDVSGAEGLAATVVTVVAAMLYSQFVLKKRGDWVYSAKSKVAG
jgi:amino acid transporter